jgi:hypothetical protein
VDRQRAAPPRQRHRQGPVQASRPDRSGQERHAVPGQHDLARTIARTRGGHEP